MSTHDAAQRFAARTLAKVGGYSPQRPGLAPSATTVWARQAQRHLHVYGESIRRVNQLKNRSLKRPVGTVSTTTGPTPRGFGGSGYSGAPAQNLGAPQIAGSVALPASAPPPSPAPAPVG